MTIGRGTFGRRRGSAKGVKNHLLTPFATKFLLKIIFCMAKTRKIIDGWFQKEGFRSGTN